MWLHVKVSDGLWHLCWYLTASDALWWPVTVHYLPNTAQFYTKPVQCHNWSKTIVQCLRVCGSLWLYVTKFAVMWQSVMISDDLWHFLKLFDSLCWYGTVSGALWWPVTVSDYMWKSLNITIYHLPFTVTCHQSWVTCHLTHVAGHLSPATCHKSHVTYCPRHAKDMLKTCSSIVSWEVLT